MAFLLRILGCRGGSVNQGTNCSYGGFRWSPQCLLEETFTSEIRIGHVSLTSVSNLLSSNSVDGPEILIQCCRECNRIFMISMIHNCAQHKLLESVISQTNPFHLFAILFVKIECSIISNSPLVFNYLTLEMDG